MSLPSTPFFAGDCGTKYLQSKAFSDGHGWPRPISYPGTPYDPAKRYIPVSTSAAPGGIVSMYPVLFPLLCAPVIAISGGRLMLLMPFLGALTAALLAGWMAGGLGQKTMPVSAILLLATPLGFYAVNVFEHSLSVAFILAGLFAVTHRGNPSAASPLAWGVFGICLGTGFWIRSELAVLLPLCLAPIAFAAHEHRLSALTTSVVGVMASLATGSLIQRLTLGFWLPVHFSRVAERRVFDASFFASRKQSIQNLFSPDWATGVALIIWLIAFVIVLASKRKTGKAVRLFTLIAVFAGLAAAFGLPALRLLGGAKPTEAFPIRTATAVWVVLCALPISLTGEQAIPGVRKTRLLLGITATWLIIGGMLSSPVDGGFQWGARFYLPTVVIATLLLLTAPAATGAWEFWRRKALGLAIGMGIAIQLFGFALTYHVSLGNAKVLDAMLVTTRPGDVILTDTFFVPELAAPAWNDRIFLYWAMEERPDDLLFALQARGVKYWVFINIADNPRNSHSCQRYLSGLNRHIWSKQTESKYQVAARTILTERYAMRLESKFQ
jgi:MFS family permease